MSIEKMKFINLVGKIEDLDIAILKIVESGLFHLENTANEETKIGNFNNITEKNPYNNAFKKINKIFKFLNISPEFKKCSFLNYKELEPIEIFLENSHFKIDKIYKNILNLKSEVKLMEETLTQIVHMLKITNRMDEIFNANCMDVHFGRLPVDSYAKLDCFKNKNFIFVLLDNDVNFCWGIYFAQKSQSKEISKSFESLYFEEYIVPNYIHETPQLATRKIKDKIENIKTKLKSLEGEVEKFKKENEAKLSRMFYDIKFSKDSFAYRQFAAVNENFFHLNGFVQESKLDEFAKNFDNLNGILIEKLEIDCDNQKFEPPVKLKTCRLFKPFETVVKTYGLPKYGNFNPSSFVGLFYSLIFGMMFGDFGQGTFVSVTGIILNKFKKSNLGSILIRCGFCSLIFGLIYDSCFGFEGLFIEFWKFVKLGNILPFNVIETKNAVMVLIFSSAFGMILTVISMAVNIFLNFKNKKIGAAIFSHNGIAGILSYGSIAFASILLVMFKINIFNFSFIVIAIVIPLILIFFCELFSNIISKFIGSKNETTEKFSAIASAFDMIDIVLSYFTNTMSFLRIGGLALSHAALMLVVMEFTKMMNSTFTFATPIVVILGNAFVMALEGLVVSIQTLRLIYYELFSRFYETGGKPFKPAKFDFKTTK